MENSSFHITRFGEKALLVQVDETPSVQLLHWLLNKKALLSEIPDVEIIHTYNELLIKFLNQSRPALEIEHTIKGILDKKESSCTQKGRNHKIPVCYDPTYGTDLETYAKAIDLSVSEIIELHTKPIYTIYFLSFLPGFPYLQGLDSSLSLPRKEIPSRKIPIGGVGIGGNQTGVYPQESPGGWHIIGQTPLELFDVSRENLSPFEAGDTLQFYAVSTKEFESSIKARQE